MKSMAEVYTDEMRKKYGKIYAAWKLGNHYELGDYGTLEDNVFTRLGNIKQLGLDFQVLIDSAPSDESYKSSGVSSNKITAEGKVVTGVSEIATGISIEFSNANSVFYEALNVRTNKISDVAQLGAQIMGLYESKKPGKNGVKWEKRYVIIFKLDVSDSATIIISNTKNAKINLHASADISGMKLNIADPKLGWDWSLERGLDSKIIANAGATPLFRLMGIRKSLFNPPVFETLVVSDSQMLPSQLRKESQLSSVEELKFVKVEDADSWTGEQLV